jgi:hypothetical protein
VSGEWLKGTAIVIECPSGDCRAYVVRTEGGDQVRVMERFVDREYIVGDRTQLVAVTPAPGHGYMSLRRDPPPAPRPAPEPVTEAEHEITPVTIRRHASLKNDCRYLVASESGEEYSVRQHNTEGYLPVGSKCRLVIHYRNGTPDWSLSQLRPLRGKPRPYRRQPGSLRVQRGRCEVWDGYEWSSAIKAIRDGYFGADEIGQEVGGHNVSGSFPGGDDEIRIRKIGPHYVLMARDLQMEDQYFRSLTRARTALRRIRRQLERESEV